MDNKGIPFDNDVEKMLDFMELSKEDFLKSYSYLSEEDYEATKKVALASAQDTYKEVTVRDILRFILNDPKYFHRGLDTVVVSGDFEGNYTHQKHELSGYAGKLVLSYEMHEGFNTF